MLTLWSSQRAWWPASPGEASGASRQPGGRAGTERLELSCGVAGLEAAAVAAVPRPHVVVKRKTAPWRPSPGGGCCCDAGLVRYPGAASPAMVLWSSGSEKLHGFDPRASCCSFNQDRIMSPRIVRAAPAWLLVFPEVPRRDVSRAGPGAIYHHCTPVSRCMQVMFRRFSGTVFSQAGRGILAGQARPPRHRSGELCKVPRAGGRALCPA